MYFSILTIGIALLGSIAKAELSNSGRTVVLGGIDYFVPPKPVGSGIIPSSSLSKLAGGSSDLFPLTIFSGNETLFNVYDLSSTVQSFSESDDVFTTSFLEAIYIQSSVPNATISIMESHLPYNVSWTYVSPETPSTILPDGPYFLNVYTGDIFQAWRLYPDNQAAFSYGVIDNMDGTFQELSANNGPAADVSVAVPSKLYYKATADKPLAGLRFGVKDIFDIAGLKTGCGCRAYFDLYPKKNVTCPSVQKLLDAGAILVGKTKPSQFANGERATADWVDIIAPFNPRGDGYQDPSSSSSGSGAAIAAYDWLDFTVGSDTGGSIRGPAGVQGVYGNRASHGSLPLDNVMPLSPALDTIGYLTRSASLFKTIGDVWYDTLPSNFTKYPTTLNVPSDFFAKVNKAAVPVINDFISKLESFLKVNSTSTNFTQYYSEHHPANASESLSELTQYIYPLRITVEQVSLLKNPFFSDYMAANDGQEPFINPTPKSRWAWGVNNSDLYDATVENMTTFNSFWVDSWAKADAQACSSSLTLYPQTSGATSYRNTYYSPPSVPAGWSAGRISSFTGAPDYVVPIGQVAYNSTVTNTTEYLPVTMSFIASYNCDLMLLNLFSDLEKAGILKSVKTGANMW